MTKERELRDLLPPGIEIRPGIYFHPRSPDASLERLRELMGSIKLTGPAPSTKFLDDDDDEEDSTWRVYDDEEQ